MDNPDLSLLFYNYLCEVIGTEEVVRMRRLIFTTMDNVISDEHATHISSGSKAECLDLNGSDIDQMMLLNKIPVYENTDEIIRNPETWPLVMDTSECKPGFTRLKICDKMSISCIPFCETLKGIVYFSSKKWKEELCSMIPESIIHGPCNSSPDGQLDLAICVRCSKWILPSKSWILRSSYLYIRQTVINAIVEFGVLFVPIGCKTSLNFDLEWRISFSYAEKLIIWSFNHVQFLCYALLKIILKEIIKETTEDLLCSYFLKTIMLWISEETKPSQWKPNRIIFCFMKCLDRLIYCVSHKTLVHYFIPDNDLFAERFNKEQHSLLLFTLNQLQGLGWTCLLQTQTLKSFTSLLVPGPSYRLIHKTSYISLLRFLSLRNGESKQELKHGVYFCLRANVKDVYLFIISSINQRISQILSTGHSSCSGNKQSYNIIRKRLCHLLIGLNFDAVSGWLLLASHFYVNKQYIVCTEIVSNCLLKCTPEKFILGYNPPKEEETRFTLLQRDLQIKSLDMIRNYFINAVRFQPSSTILPEEMYMLDDREDEVLTIPPVAFGCFLKYLCEHHLGNQTEKDISLRELEWVINNKYFVINRRSFYYAQVLLSVAYSLKNAVN